MESYPTIQLDDTILSPDEVRDEVRRVARGLIAAGVRDGDVIAIMLRNGLGFVAGLLACRLVGAYACAVNWHFKEAETRSIIADCKAKLALVHADFLNETRAVWSEHLSKCIVVGQPVDQPLPDQVEFGCAWIRYEALGAEVDVAIPENAPVRWPLGYTSGSSGHPKGVVRLWNPAENSAARFAEMAAISQAVFGIDSQSRCLLSGPLYHGGPLTFALSACQQGAHLVLEPRFDARRTLQLVESRAITHAYLVPTMYNRLLQLPRSVRESYDVGSIKFVSSTGSPCSPQLKHAMIEWWGPVIHETYGSSETGYLTLASPQDSLSHPGTAGRALPGTTLRIIDDKGQDAAPNVVGLIYARQSAYPDFTYLNNDGARRVMALGELVTLGDMGYLDEAGYLYICARASDMVISGGVNIYPEEIERVILQLEGVADCAVFGIPDAEFGEALAAVVQPKTGATLDTKDVMEFVKANLANFKVPRLVTFQSELPREDSGKIFKRKLRDPFWAGHTRRV
jgi:long-chain acyl-CoA synthetase